MLHKIKKLVPKRVLSNYHLVLSHISAFLYRYPSNKLKVIGVTGTNGKSTTVQLIGHLLMELGETIGWTTTASFRIADHEKTNDKKMTMLGRSQTHKMLREMVNKNCTYAIVETSSQGIEQHRHVGINYDTIVFTNLTPEHIEAHGGFENYKAAKLKLFKALASMPKKRIDKKLINKTIAVNLNDKHAQDFAYVNVDKIIGYGHDNRKLFDVSTDEKILAHNISLTQNSTTAEVNSITLKTNLVGQFYLENTLAAISALASFNFPLEKILKAATKLNPVEGRLETFTKNGITVIVDYAYEPTALTALYRTINLFKKNDIIHVTGSAGGGRDKARRKTIGELVAKNSQTMIITNEDPYDEDPQSIIDEIAEAAINTGKIERKTLFRILDRQSAIIKAIELAKPGDIVLVTGKGSEPVMAVAGGKKIKSDDRIFVKNAL